MAYREYLKLGPLIYVFSLIFMITTDKCSVSHRQSPMRVSPTDLECWPKIIVVTPMEPETTLGATRMALIIQRNHVQYHCAILKVIRCHTDDTITTSYIYIYRCIYNLLFSLKNKNN